MRRLPILVGLLIPGLLAAAAPPCISDPELMAEAAARYLVEQEYRAVLCAYAHDGAVESEPGGFLQLARDIATKFDLQFSRYQELRRARFRRLFGERWELALRGDRLLKLWHLRRDIPRLEEEACAASRAAMETAFKRDWAALRQSLEPARAALRSRTRVCSIETAGLYPPFADEDAGTADTKMPPLPGFPEAKTEKPGAKHLLPGFRGVAAPR